MSSTSSSAQRVLFDGPVDERVGYWLTPPELMGELQGEFGFNYDACPYPRPPGFDGLREEWGSRAWVNPPFRKVSVVEWGRKAIAEASKGKLVVLILPLQRSEHLVGPMRDAGAEIRVLPPVAWRNPEGRATKRPACQILFILRGHR